MFADPAVAQLFGLDQEEAATGLPIERYLDRVHPDDRPALARTLRDVIVTPIPQQSNYHVRNAEGRYQVVLAFGRSFHDKDRQPKLYSGIIVPAGGLDVCGKMTH